MDRIIGKVRICNVSLFAVNCHFRANRASPSHLDHVAKYIVAGRLAHQGEIDHGSTFYEGVQGSLRSVDRPSFLVAGDQ